MNIITIQTTRLLRSLTLLCCIFLISGTMAWGQYSGGTGTEAAPFQIANAADLVALATAVNGGTTYSDNFFQQTADIELTDEWIEIGNKNKSFNGSYDGNGKKISHIKITNPPTNKDYYYVGLFGNISNGSVKNLTLVNPEISITTARSPYVGFIAGYTSGTTISNCNISDGSMTITTTSTEHIYAGGIVGYGNGTITNSSCTSCVMKAFGSSSAIYLGGIHGNSSMKIEQCNFSGKVIALGTNTSLAAGGIAGSARSISFCTVKGSVQAISTKGNVNAGGIAGGNTTVRNCISLCSEVVGLSSSTFSNTGRVSESGTLSDNLATPTMKKRIYNGTYGTSNLESIFTSLTAVTDQNIATCSIEEAAVPSAAGKDGADITYNTVENIFANDQQGDGSGSDATKPSLSGNKDGLKMYGTYSADNNYQVTILSGESNTETSLSGIANNWVLAKTDNAYTNLCNQAPMLWKNDRPDATTAINFTDNTTLDTPIAFAPAMTITIAEDKTFTLPAEEDNSYALPAISLPGTTAGITISQPKALASVEQLKIAATLPAKDDANLYANLSMPFVYGETVLTEATYVAYNAANRADKGTAGQVNWTSVAGKNWLATRGDSESSLSFSSNLASDALAAVRGVRYDKDGIEIQEKLAYAHGVTAGKSTAWKNAHFGWNIVNSGSIRAKEVTLSDPEISAIQYLTADGGYTTVVKNTTGNTGAFTLAPYTAYFVQATGEDQTANGTLRSGDTDTAISAVLALMAEDGTVFDRILATAGESLPGRNVEKMGIGQHNLYIDKAGMKCAAADKEGRFEVKVTNTGKPNTTSLCLVSLTGGETATWNGIPIRIGESFAAGNGILRLKGTATANETPVSATFHAWGTRGSVVIEGAETGAAYRLVNTSGKEVASGTIADNRTTVAIGTPGIYFVTVGERTVKVIVK